MVKAKAPTPAQLIARAQKKARAERITALFLGTLRARGIPLPVAEHRFDLERKWRFDFAWPESALAVEQEGLGGRHQRTVGFLEDMTKYNTAAHLGWTVFRFSTRQMTDGTAAEWVESFLHRKRRA